jgi:hypothetical protein
MKEAVYGTVTKIKPVNGDRYKSMVLLKNNSGKTYKVFLESEIDLKVGDTAKAFITSQSWYGNRTYYLCHCERAGRERTGGKVYGD